MIHIPLAALGALLFACSGPRPAAVAASPAPTTPPAVQTVAADARGLYSAHARRLIRTYLRLRMLELREADLDRARAVIEGRLKVDDLLPAPHASP